MSSVSQQSTRATPGKIFKGILVLQAQKQEIPIRYWLVKPATIDYTSEWQPSICENNIITDCFGQQIQFRIHNKAKNGKFLSEEFTQLCEGPSEVLCDGIEILTKENYLPYTMIFSDKPEWTFYMATNSCNQLVDYIM
jgi:hypothetical protein